MSKKIRNKIILVGILLTLLISNLKDYEYHPNYQILEEEEAYARYRDGDIYIGEEKDLKNINCDSSDVLVCDNRKISNSDLKIYNSYKVTDKEARNDIIEVLMHYEEENPSTWNRTKESMRLEWFLHNLFYYLSLEKKRSTDVDLDSEDEKVYDCKVLRKILKL